MDKVYDNGTAILGKVHDVKKYLIKYAEETWEVEDLIRDLEDFDESTIVAVNYDCGMGYSIDYWEEKDEM